MLGATERLTIGLGLIPVPLRNVAVLAMELATLQRMFPGRLRVGVGHGVQDWMGQVGGPGDVSAYPDAGARHSIEGATQW